GFTPALFPQLREEFIAFLQKSGKDEKTECYIPLVVNNLTSTGRARFKVLRTTDAWFGVTYREDRPRVIESVRTLITRGEYPEKLWA
ncbi:MAG TPA: nucleotidyltransferase, partial [Verrucomicrobiae bacterium]